jgi:AP-1-like transcription factor
VAQKRKAQNRAAQRAFRERKEKHLKDLETKVVELEKRSEATSSENAQLRAQLEAVTEELNEYKRKMQTPNGRAVSGGRLNKGFGHAAINNLSDVNFQFEFPKFGVLPGPVPQNKPVRQNTTSSLRSPNGGNAVSPSQQTNNERTVGATPNSVNSLSTAELASFSAVFSGQHAAPAMNGVASRGSLDSGHRAPVAANTSSPSASSNSNMGPSSSCGTSPEPFNQSPMGFKPLDTMTTIGEEPSSLTAGNLQSKCLEAHLVAEYN